MNSPIDHLVFATHDLAEGIELAEDMLSLRAVHGGSHQGLGTSNAHISLGNRCYLEIIGPDPDQPDFDGVRPFGIDELEHPKLMSWAARRSELSGFVKMANAKGVELSDVISMTRITPEGNTLEWELSFPLETSSNQVMVVPFFIDWGTSPHPTSHRMKSAQLLALELIHPDPDNLAKTAQVLELDVNVSIGAEPKLNARILCPSGEILLN